MAVSHDTSAESHSGGTGSVSEGSFTINITLAAGCKGVVVGVATAADADYITSVAIDGGGGALTQFAEAADTATEPMRVTGFFLANPPTGARIITITRTNNATVMYALAHSVIASSTPEIYAPGIVLLQEDGTIAEQNVDDGSPGTNSLRFAFNATGHGTAVSVGANSTAGQGIIISPAVWTFRSYYETTAGQGSRPVGGSSGTSDDRACIHFAVREVPAAGTVIPVFMNQYRQRAA